MDNIDSDRFIDNCPKCNSGRLLVKYYMQRDDIVSFIECQECKERFYHGALGESEVENEAKFRLEER